MGLLFGAGRLILEMPKRKQNHSACFSASCSIKESYLQTGKRATNMVKKEQRLQIIEEIVREYQAAFNELKIGARLESHIPDN